jgi:hypothetical protein
MKNGKKIWMQESDSVTKHIKQDNVGQVILIDKIGGSNGVTLAPKTGGFTLKSNGEYLVVAPLVPSTIFSIETYG